MWSQWHFVRILLEFTNHNIQCIVMNNPGKFVKYLPRKSIDFWRTISLILVTLFKDFFQLKRQFLLLWKMMFATRYKTRYFQRFSYCWVDVRLMLKKEIILQLAAYKTIRVETPALASIRENIKRTSRSFYKTNSFIFNWFRWISQLFVLTNTSKHLLFVNEERIIPTRWTFLKRTRDIRPPFRFY